MGERMSNPLGSAIGVGLRFNKPSDLTKAHVIADKIFHALAQISMENESVLFSLSEILEEGAQGEYDADEPRIASLLVDIASTVNIIREGLLKEEG